MEFDFTKEPGQRLLNRKLNHTGEPLVSVITPYYNAGKYFEQTFNCVMNQTFPWFEWIIADDGSTDDASLAVLDRFAARDDRIRVFHKENGGISTARNLAIRKAKTDIIIPLDADDLIVPTYLETQYWALRQNPDCDWSYSNNIGFHNQQYKWDKPFDPELLRTYNYLCYCGAIRKNVLEAVGCYDEVTKHYYEDWRLWLKLLTAHKKPVKTANYGFWYRRLDSGVLSLVNNDPKTQKLAKHLIQEVAETADTTITAKTYPAKPAKDCYSAPKVSNWERKVFAKHDRLQVLMLLPWMEMGGADLFNLDVCARLDRNRFEVGILTTQRAENTWQQRFEEYVTDIFNLPDFLDMENWPEFISYYIRSREVDVLFLSNSYYGYYLVPWLRKEFPALAIMDYVHMEEWYWRNGGYARCSGVMGEILEKTLVCNERTRQVMITDFGRNPESVETLYIGVDHEKYDAAAVEAGQTKQRLGIAENRPLILFPCRLHPQKRPFLMLEIAKELQKKLPDAAFAVVGDGPQLEELKTAVRQAGMSDTVYFAGRQDDMLPWYRDAALTLICSLKEGLALTAYESLSMGVPVVTSDVGGQRELIDGSVGRIVPLQQSEAADMENRVYSPEEIGLYVDAIRGLLADGTVYARMRLACRKRIEDGFSSRNMIQGLETALTELAHGTSAQQARQETACALRKLGAYVDDALGTYLRCEAKEQEAEEVWKGREWFRMLYEKEVAERSNGAIPSVPVYTNEAERQLSEIYNMRSWKLIQRYRHFMDETRLGRIIRRLRDTLFHRAADC